MRQGSALAALVDPRGADPRAPPPALAPHLRRLPLSAPQRAPMLPQAIGRAGRWRRRRAAAALGRLAAWPAGPHAQPPEAVGRGPGRSGAAGAAPRSAVGKGGRR
jgi:hypothetical protein